MIYIIAGLLLFIAIFIVIVANKLYRVVDALNAILLHMQLDRRVNIK